jgi:hypothetical protein
MRAVKLPSIRAALAVLAVLVLAAPAARAQDGDVLRARELRGAPPVLYDALAQLRPAWLQMAGDSAAEGRVVVFLNGRHTGDTRVLRTMRTEDVVLARLRSSEFVRRTDPRFPRDEFDVAIYVSTRGQQAPAAGRVTVSLDAGFDLRSIPAAMDDGLADAGFDAKVLVTEQNVARFSDEGTSSPASVGATVHYGMRGNLGVALSGVHTLQGWSGGYSREVNQAVSARLTSTEGLLLLTRDVGVVRAGVGAAYRQVSWAWASHFCQCSNEQSRSGGAAGAAAEAVVRIPLARVVPGFRLLARYYPSQKAEYEPLKGSVDVGGFIVTMGVSLGARF